MAQLLPEQRRLLFLCGTLWPHRDRTYHSGHHLPKRLQLGCHHGCWMGNGLLRLPHSQHWQPNESFCTAWFLLMLLAPLWINAYIYMALGRMVYNFTSSARILKLKAWRFGLYFVLLDILYALPPPFSTKYPQQPFE